LYGDTSYYDKLYEKESKNPSLNSAEKSYYEFLQLRDEKFKEFVKNHNDHDLRKGKSNVFAGLAKLLLNSFSKK